MKLNDNLLRQTSYTVEITMTYFRIRLFWQLRYRSDTANFFSWTINPNVSYIHLFHLNPWSVPY